MSRSNAQVKVGIVVLTALAILLVTVVLVGEKDHLFSHKNHYFVRFSNVLGLTEGNPVQLSGVNVGKVDRIVVPEDIKQDLLEVWISVDRRYANRVREDSMARIKTLGLLGDRYIEITSGSAAAEVIPSGEEIPTAPTTDVEQLLASGEDVMENVTAISASLKDILAKVASGDSVVGAFLSPPEPGEKSSKEIRQGVVRTLASLEKTAKAMESGDGTLPRLIHDDELANRLDSAVGHLEQVLTKVDQGDGLLPTMLNDPESAERLKTSLAAFEATTTELQGLVTDLRQGDGLLSRLLEDDAYADQVTDNLEKLLRNLREVSEKLSRGDGTAAKLIDDPSLYQAMNDIVVGVNESKMLRWLIRNRQKKGIKKRYHEAHGQAEAPPEEAAAPPVVAEPPPAP
ncbi:MAG: MCE family protein [Acidobacteria bacterium]|nr:MCE family protein [Acidobacteriota bacterium]